MLFVVSLDQQTQGIDEAVARVLGAVAHLVDQLIQLNDGAVVLAHITNG